MTSLTKYGEKNQRNKNACGKTPCGKNAWRARADKAATSRTADNENLIFFFLFVQQIYLSMNVMMKMKEGTTWDGGTKINSFPQLKNSVHVDVLIIGGGITGITCAYLLSQSKLKVALIEKSKLGFGATGVTTAFLTESIDTYTSDLIKMFGAEKTKSIIGSHKYAINETEKIIKENKIACEFSRCSNYVFSVDEKSAELLEEEEKETLALGIQIYFKKDSKLNFKNSGYLEIKNQAKFHPLKYLSALTKLASKNGVKFFEKTEATKISGENKYLIETPNAKISADKIIVATYAPFNDELYFKRAHYDSYVFELEAKSNLQDGTYEDTLTPYHYFRVDKSRIIFGGEDHRSDFPIDDSKCFQALEDYFKKIFPKLKYKIVRKWKGPILESIDGLAYIGNHKDKNIFYATGFSGNGMTYSMIATQIIVYQILGKKDAQLKKFAEIYNPSRIPTLNQLAHKGLDYSKEMIGGAIKNSLKYKKK